ncbi:S8 family serine peptidase [Catellatospora chokoriensis]|uniref:Type VII secretion-associated serine protease n=1 Tax=Catellatospora chokoriensis TaxID=310353 RepID=A0A8J3NRR2_9ACTN|nr:S8 family serine peptidase [Catellatospora chokoriensis]GIF90447.1 type VII secretion-associated serine protease [Catellatospora chokoriensis]
MTTPMRPLRAIVAALLTAAVISTGARAEAADAISDGQWYLKALDTAAAHRISQGKGVKVGVIDSGVDATHPDLRGSVEAGGDFSRAGAGDSLTDTDGHGTSMASLIAGHGQIKGVAPAAKIVSIKVSDGFSGSATAVGQAITWASEHGIRIVSISSGYDSDDLVLQQAVTKARGKGMIIVAAAGNKPDATTVQYPAAYNGVIAVGATDKNGNLSNKSVSGPQLLLAAPGDSLSTAHRDKRRVITTGTSNSAALVAGAAALVLAAHPDISAEELTRRLTSTATDKGPAGRDDQYGYGIINITAALTVAAASTPAAAPTSAAAAPPSPPLAAPGADFPTRTALTAGIGCLLVLTSIGAALAILNRRRSRS